MLQAVKGGRSGFCGALAADSAADDSTRSSSGVRSPPSVKNRPVTRPTCLYTWHNTLTSVSIPPWLIILHRFALAVQEQACAAATVQVDPPMRHDQEYIYEIEEL